MIICFGRQLPRSFCLCAAALAMLAFAAALAIGIAGLVIALQTSNKLQRSSSDSQSRYSLGLAGKNPFTNLDQDNYPGKLFTERSSSHVMQTAHVSRCTEAKHRMHELQIHVYDFKQILGSMCCGWKTSADPA